MPNIQIRPARFDDCALIASFIHELAVYEKLQQEVECTPPILEESLFGDTPRAYALLAEADGAPAGFCLYFYNFSTFLGRPGIYIEDIFVREPFRSLGIGTLFFNAIFAIAKRQNCGRVEWSVLDWNRPAIAFYEKMGAKAMSEWLIYRMDRDRFIVQTRNC
jgi:GNAT superfamily N-acetyltransferase